MQRHPSLPSVSFAQPLSQVLNPKEMYDLQMRVIDKLSQEMQKRLEDRNRPDSKKELTKFVQLQNKHPNRREKAGEWLRSAILGGKTSIVDFLCKNYLINIPEAYIFKGLLCAIRQGETKLALTVINKGQPFFQMELEGTKYCALELAVKNKMHDVAMEILEDNQIDFSYGVNKDGRYLLKAVKNHDSRMINMLLKVRAPLNETDNEGNTPLLVAAKQGALITLIQLIRAGADMQILDKEGMSVVHQAALNHNPEVLITLIDNGGSLTGLTKCGMSPTLLAIKSGDQIKITFMHSKGADSSQPKEGLRKTPLAYAAEIAEPNIYELVFRLWGPDTSSPKPPLWQAIKHGRTDIVTAAGDMGEDLNRRATRDEKTALHEAARCNKPACIKILASRGARTDITDVNGETALITAIKSGATNAAEALLQCKADPMAQDSLGRHALSTAIVMNKPAIVRLLIEFGAQVNQKDKFDYSPLIYATKRNSADVVRTLLENGADAQVRTSDNRNLLQICADDNLLAAQEQLKIWEGRKENQARTPPTTPESNSVPAEPACTI